MAVFQQLLYKAYNDKIQDRCTIARPQVKFFGE